MGFRRKRRPVIPGQTCPADRTNSARDPRVTITDTGSHYRTGTRTCARCGRPDVPMRQAWGARESAWYYGSHTVPGPSVQEPEHGPDWSDWGVDHPDEGPSCRCGFNGTPEECQATRSSVPESPDA